MSNCMKVAVDCERSDIRRREHGRYSVKFAYRPRAGNGYPLRQYHLGRYSFQTGIRTRLKALPALIRPHPVPVFISSETVETRAIDVLPEYRKRQRCKDRNQPGPGAGKGTVKRIAPGVSPVSFMFFMGGKGGVPVVRLAVPSGRLSLAIPSPIVPETGCREHDTMRFALLVKINETLMCHEP